jgi:hypothetical protein
MNLKFLRWTRRETGRNFKFTALASPIAVVDAADFIALLELVAVGEAALARLVPRFLLGPECSADLMLVCKQGPHAAFNTHDVFQFPVRPNAPTP